MSAHHRLKTWKQYFDASFAGEKPFELRRNDRGFQKGDTVELVEVEDEYGGAVRPGSHFNAIETGRTLRRRITYVLSHPEIAPGYALEAAR